MNFERCTELEAQLRDGRLTVRDFIRGLAKSNFTRAGSSTALLHSGVLGRRQTSPGRAPKLRLKFLP